MMYQASEIERNVNCYSLEFGNRFLGKPSEEAINGTECVVRLSSSRYMGLQKKLGLYLNFLNCHCVLQV
jgi:hypothetical protein